MPKSLHVDSLLHAKYFEGSSGGMRSVSGAGGLMAPA